MNKHGNLSDDNYSFDAMLMYGGGDTPLEGDWNDEEDEDFDDLLDDKDDLNELRADDDTLEPDPEDDDHLPDEDL